MGIDAHRVVARLTVCNGSASPSFTRISRLIPKETSTGYVNLPATLRPFVCLQGPRPLHAVARMHPAFAPSFPATHWLPHLFPAAGQRHPHEAMGLCGKEKEDDPLGDSVEKGATQDEEGKEKPTMVRNLVGWCCSRPCDTHVA